MNPGILVGAGFLLGSVGVKALTSKKAKQVYVKGIVQGMRAKEEVETMVDEARAEFDDLLAEAGYVKDSDDESDSANLIAESEDTESTTSNKTTKNSSASDEALKEVVKTVSSVTKSAAGKGAGKGGHGHGHGRAGK